MVIYFPTRLLLSIDCHVQSKIHRIDLAPWMFVSPKGSNQIRRDEEVLLCFDNVQLMEDYDR